MIDVQSSQATGAPKPPGPTSPGWAEAKAFEARFLAEMLKHTGFNRPRDGLGGGTGEAQFSSMLLEAQADRMVEAGGIGLAEAVWRATFSRSADA